MTIAALITQGIGPGGSVLYIVTGGLDIGAQPVPPPIWTPVVIAGGSWSPETGNTDIWTPVTPASSPWT